MARQEVIFAPELRHRRVVERIHHLRAVAANHVERLTVGAEQHGVRTMLAAAVDLAKLLDLVELVVLVRVGHAVEAALVFASLVDDD